MSKRGTTGTLNRQQPFFTAAMRHWQVIAAIPGPPEWLEKRGRAL
jgi:hypothetical protein